VFSFEGDSIVVVSWWTRTQIILPTPNRGWSDGRRRGSEMTWFAPLCLFN